MTILIAVPYRENTPQVFVQMTLNHANSLTSPDKRLVMFPNAIAPTWQKYEANAIARNRLIEEHLQDDDEFVLWLDVDLVSVPANLIEVLMQEGGGHICAPLIFVERVRRGPISPKTGGWFYDTGAYIKDGAHAELAPPIWPDYAGGTVEVESVGCCYLIPADVYRMGARYSVTGDSVEHVVLMEEARALGFRVFMTDRAKVEHAYLPKYGVEWH